ncbi:hypothetical protein P5V15_005746 [Pogonomyrmex californicus]
MTVIELISQIAFDDFVESKNLSVIHFYATWLEQCTQMDEVLEEMSKLEEYKEVKFARLEAETVPEVSLKCEVVVAPTIILLRNSRVVDRVDGVKVNELTEKIKYHMSYKVEDPPYQDPMKPRESFESKLKALINQAPCMLFMKGNPTNPRCGFSRTIVSILDNYNTDYKSFDILQDNDVREGLKKFSNWPTYPQLYINGELIGGLDIVNEMNESGELESLLPKKE